MAIDEVTHGSSKGFFEHVGHTQQHKTAVYFVLPSGTHPNSDTSITNFSFNPV